MAKEIGQSGWRVYLNVGEELIPTEITNTLNINNSLIDITDKSTGGWTGNLDGRRDWSIDIELNYDPEDAISMALVAKIMDPTTSSEMPIIVGKQTSVGDIGYEGSAVIGSISITGPDQEAITMSATLTGNGALTQIIKA